jgi:NAD(P)-dependent dehydrogenase (short-subunit alcohol dehydrogenase family)
MKVKLKRLRDQVIVITGASSGIGLATARLAARGGARVVLTSRDGEDLPQVVDQIRAEGGTAVFAVADVADFEALKGVAATAMRDFGTIDTWVNNAGVSIYGPIEDVGLMDARRLFETNYWGVVHGTLAALPHLKAHGGALINVGSVLSNTGYPLQGHYTASKHAVKGFTDSIRVELEHERSPVSVTLIQPAAIDTPYPEHAKSYLGLEPTHTPPVYAPEVVARTILSCAQRPQRNVLVGGGARALTALEHMAPALGDRFKEMAVFKGQRSARPADRTETLFGPRPGDTRERGGYEGHVMESSAYTAARLHRRQTLLGLALAGATVALLDRAGVFGDAR